MRIPFITKGEEPSLSPMTHHTVTAGHLQVDWGLGGGRRHTRGDGADEVHGGHVVTTSKGDGGKVLEDLTVGGVYRERGREEGRDSREKEREKRVREKVEESREERGRVRDGDMIQHVYILTGPHLVLVLD